MKDFAYWNFNPHKKNFVYVKIFVIWICLMYVAE
jgi:hypothetical protein